MTNTDPAANAMRNSIVLTRILAVVIATITLSCCRSSTLTSASISPHSEPQLYGQGRPLQYLILGDSTTVAEGGTYENGLAAGTARHLGRSARVELVNLGISGATVRDVLTIELPRAQTLKPDIVLVVAGSNDVTHLTSRSAIHRDLVAILDQILTLNCEAKVVVTGAADMGSPPRIPRILRGFAAGWSKWLNGVFRDVTANRQMTFAPIAEKTGPLFRADHSLFFEDGFHPNDRGYALWTTVINAALDEALKSQPTHCAPR